MSYQVFPTDNGFDLAVYLPGYTKDEVKLSRQGNYIIIEGEAKSKYAASPDFQYKFKLTERMAKPDAEMHDGILVVHMKYSSADAQSIIIR